jgi:hypothetical protein
VAKIVGASLAPLSTDEQTALNAYINRIKFSGTATGLISLIADLLRMSGTYYYDPLLLLDDVKADIDAKVAAYLANLDFNGKVHLQQLVDAIQSALGYKDLDLDTLEAKPSGAVAWTAFDLDYLPTAGYFELDQPVSDMLTFAPYV